MWRDGVAFPVTPEETRSHTHVSRHPGRAAVNLGQSGCREPRSSWLESRSGERLHCKAGKATAHTALEAPRAGPSSGARLGPPIRVCDLFPSVAFADAKSTRVNEDILKLCPDSVEILVRDPDNNSRMQ